jgi:uncharacterized protein
VDAEACARAGSAIARHFSAADLPRLREAGGLEGSSIEAEFQFSMFDGRPAVAGQLQGVAVVTCQRCMQPVSIDVSDRFQVLIVDAERSDEPGGYEPVVAKPSRLDLGWLAEEQVLLALPLVPMHDSEACGELPVELLNIDAPAAAAGEENAAETRHQPFQNLRDLLRKQ